MMNNFNYAFATAGGAPNLWERVFPPTRGANILYEMECNGGSCDSCGDVLCPFCEGAGRGQRTAENDDRDNKDNRLSKAKKSNPLFALALIAGAIFIFIALSLVWLLL